MEPVFIGGCDRSGTTMFAAMLAANRNAAAVPELLSKPDLFALADEGGRLDPRSAADFLRGHRDPGIWGFTPDELRDALQHAEATPAGVVRAMVAAYLAREERLGVRRWIDHTPANLAMALQLLDAFPEARFIHIVRDGRAVAASMLGVDWGPNTVLHMARWWAAKVGHGLAAESALGPDRIRRVRYEDVCTDPDGTLGSLCDWLGWPYESAMRDGRGFRVPESSRSIHALVGRAPDASRIHAWRQKLAPRDLELFEALTGDLLPMLGYELVHHGRARQPSNVERLRAGAHEAFARLLFNPVRMKARLNADARRVRRGRSSQPHPRSATPTHA